MGFTFMRIYVVYYTLAFLIHANDGAKILGIFPMPVKSHFTCNNAIMKSLIEANHEVTVITSFPEQASAENYSSIIDVSAKGMIFVGQSKIDEFATQNVFRFLNLTNDMEHPFCAEVLKLPEIQRILKSNEKLYDVVFVEVLLFYKCFLHVAEKMNVPVIGTVTMRTWILADIGMNNPYHPAYLSFEPLTQKWHLDHILGRIVNSWSYIVMAWYKIFISPKLIRQFHDENSHLLNSLGRYMDIEPDIIFYNNHASLLPRPMNPNAIDVGGIHTNNAKPLPLEIQKFIDEADHGVILFTLGSIVRAASMTSEMKNAFKNAFAEIPQRVIWKFEEKMENVPSNILLLDWLPQRDILEHKNVIAFISHCGLGGTNEAVYTATPVIACPLFADQLDNAKLLEDHGAAVHLDFHDITKENILNALNAIINNTSYRDNMRKLSNRFKDRPMTPQQSVVYWTEYVIRHQGASHLRSPASRLSWLQFFMLDVIFIVTTVLVIFVFLLYFIIRIFLSHFVQIRCFNKFRKPKNKKL
ncbi:UDP-glucosyltransferase 2-like [Planococcus citri]|uniref:UDP-glucosyltransferase 2-like n=1 Tax=Planococcus citri TaxID=170843 RepID=UPI0031F89486